MDAVSRLFDIARAELESILFAFGERLPYLLTGLLLTLIFFLLSVFAARLTRSIASRFIDNRLLLSVATRALTVVFILLGCYLGLRVSGLSQLAATILGGTGLVGLMFGFAFRDIAENFLASILLSVHRPFRVADVVEIDGHIGVVERLTMRCTVIMNFDGDHIQIPNGRVFKSTIRNITANENQRESFVIGVSYAAILSEVQAVIHAALQEHPAVLSDPPTRVLVEKLGAATVNIRVYYWMNILTHDPLATQSSVIHRVKTAIEAAGISLPDEAREVIFPEGIPIVHEKDKDEKKDKVEKAGDEPPSRNKSARGQPGAGKAIDEPQEDLSSDRQGILKQMESSESPESGENLL